MRPIYAASSNGLQGAVAHSAICVTGFSYEYYTTNRTNRFMSHLKDEVIMVKCLVKVGKLKTEKIHPCKIK